MLCFQSPPPSASQKVPVNEPLPEGRPDQRNAQINFSLINLLLNQLIQEQQLPEPNPLFRLSIPQ